MPAPITTGLRAGHVVEPLPGESTVPSPLGTLMGHIEGAIGKEQLLR